MEIQSLTILYIDFNKDLIHFEIEHCSFLFCKFSVWCNLAILNNITYNIYICIHVCMDFNDFDKQLDQIWNQQISQLCIFILPAHPKYHLKIKTTPGVYSLGGLVLGGIRGQGIWCLDVPEHVVYPANGNSKAETWQNQVIAGYSLFRPIHTRMEGQKFFGMYMSRLIFEFPDRPIHTKHFLKLLLNL